MLGEGKKHIMTFEDQKPFDVLRADLVIREAVLPQHAASEAAW